MARLISFADCPPVAWKNGTGSTRELWRIDDAEGQMLARVSVASIAGAQAFSSFPGIDRIIMQLTGPPVLLHVDGRAQPLLPFTPFAFAGEATVDSTVTAPAQDLNLMCRRSSFHPAMQVVEGQAGQDIGFPVTSAHRLVMALQPVAFAVPETLALASHDVVVLARGETIRVQAQGRLVLLDVQAM